MSDALSIHLKPPYLLFIGDVDRQAYAKTALGIARWCPDRVAGQLRFQGNTLDLGLADLTVEQAFEAGIKSLVIGVAPIGGTVDKKWQAELIKAAALGMDIVSGLHLRLETIPELQHVASQSGAELINVRVPPANLPIADGRKRSGKRVLMVGTDCAVGKKYTALAMTQSLQRLGVNATFRATGQTGIMIAGNGIPIDATVADFVAGAAELVSPDNDVDHWDVIEGQGSLFNPSYAGVSLGLLHGSQPDAFVVCHDATRTMIDSCPHIRLPSIPACIELHRLCGQLTNPKIRCIGVSVNTSGLPLSQRQAYLDKVAGDTGLPCIDSVVHGCDAIARQLLEPLAISESVDA